MPKKDKSRKKKTGNEGSRNLVLKEDGQEYGVAGKALGSGHFKVTCQDGKERLCVIRGNMRNKGATTRINEGDLVLIGLREFEDGKADIIGKYSVDESRKLKKMGEVTMDSNEKDKDKSVPDNDDDESGFDFETL